jgi:hypothetical protein
MTDYKNFEKIISDKLPKLDVLDVINICCDDVLLQPLVYDDVHFVWL